MILKITDIFLKKKQKRQEKTLMNQKKNFHGDIDSVDYEDLDNYDYDDYSYFDDDKYRKIGSVRRLFKGLDRDCFKPIRTDDDVFAGIDNNYMGYVSKGDIYEKLSP